MIDPKIQAISNTPTASFESMINDPFHQYVTEKEAVHTKKANGSWQFFPPSHYSFNGLLNEDLLKELKDKQSKLLSVSAGPAYLEQFLVSEGVKKSNIHLADSSTEELPDDFNKHIFDFTNPWPAKQSLKDFDIIIFPESFAQAIFKNPAAQLRANRPTEEDIIKKAAEILNYALSALKPGGKILVCNGANKLNKENLPKILPKINPQHKVQVKFQGWGNATTVIEKVA